MGLFSGDNGSEGGEDRPEEIREAEEAERELEKVKRKVRSKLIQHLSSGKFEEAEELAEETLESKENFYRFAASVAELLMSRKLARARNWRLKSKAFLKTLYNNRQMDTASTMAHKKLRNCLEKMKENIEDAPDEIEKSKEIMKRYSNNFHRIDKEGEQDVFEYLVDMISLKREELDELRDDYNEMVQVKNQAVDGNYRPMKNLIKEIDREKGEPMENPP
jgi:hypothetical protein